MAEDEKPFRCYQPDCDMRFTNEDHLSVHMKKHDMSLALNLGPGLGGLSPMGLCDQTPTPTKFLKNCEELGLFQELSKNPFEDSFKKALDVPGDEPDTSGLPGPGVMLILDSPLPSSVPKIVTENFAENGEREDSIKSPTKTLDHPLSSIVPKKREKFLSSHVLPTSTTSEDEEIPAASSTNTENEIKPVDDLLADSVKPVEEFLVDSVKPVEEMLADSVDQILADGAEVLGVSSSDTGISTELPDAAHTVNIAAMANQSKPAVVPGQVTMQALLQLPNGQTIPVQLPGSVIAQPQVVPVQTVSPPRSTPAVAQNTANMVVQGNTQFIQTVPNIVQQKPVMQGVVQNLSGAVHNLPIGLVQSTVNRTLPIQTMKLGPTQTSHPVPVQTGNQSLVTTVISPEKQTVTQNNPGLKTVIAPQIVVQSAQKQMLVSPKPQNQSTSKTSPSQGSQTYTKQRLKAALTGHVTPSSTMKINHIFKIVEESKQEIQLSQDSLSVASTSDTVSSPDEVPLPPLKQPRTEAEDSEDKRKKFLERNRAAAARCRQKRKSWIYNLESKAEELSSVNNKLQGEIKQLRGEVAHLKQLLIAHKDCPVTMQQKSLGQVLPQSLPQEDSSSQSSDMDIEQIEILPTVNGEVTAAPGIPNVIRVEQLGVPIAPTTTNVPIVTSVLTGPNSVGMIPTIVNLDFFSRKDPT